MSEVVIEIGTACISVLLISLIVRARGVVDPFDTSSSRFSVARERFAYALVALPYVVMSFYPIPFVAFVIGVWGMSALSRRLAVPNESWLWVRSNLMAVFLVLPHAVVTAPVALAYDESLREITADPLARCFILLGSLVFSIGIGSIVGKRFSIDENTDEAFGKSLRPLSWFAWFALAYIAFDALANDVDAGLASLNLFVLASQILLGIGLVAFASSSGRLGRDAFREEQYLRLAEEAHAEEARMEDLHRKAYTDALTGLESRRSAVDSIQLLLDEGRQFSLAFIDMNDFKSINDTYGHAQGDASLVRVADALRAAFGPEARISRMGGDEFLAVLEGVDAAEAEACAHVALSEVGRTDGDALALSFCFGVLDASTADQDPSQLIRMADAAMYEHKNAYHGDRAAKRSGWEDFSDGEAPDAERKE